MSLISEALKKAQRQRTENGEAPAADAAQTPAARVERREKPPGFQSQMMMVIGGAAAVVALAVVAGGIWLWRSGRPPEPAAPQVATAATAPAATPQHAAPSPAPTPPPPVAPETKHVEAPAVAQAVAATPPPVANRAPVAAVPQAPVALTVAPPPTPAPPAAATATSAGGPQFTLPLPQSEPAVQTAAAQPITLPTVGADRPAEKPKPPPHMITIINNLRVAGIRASGGDSKVLMNDRVYRLNDIIDPEMGLRLVGVTPTSLTFQDDRGASYTRNF